MNTAGFNFTSWEYLTRRLRLFIENLPNPELSAKLTRDEHEKHKEFGHRRVPGEI